MNPEEAHEQLMRGTGSPMNREWMSTNPGWEFRGSEYSTDAARSVAWLRKLADNIEDTVRMGVTENGTPLMPFVSLTVHVYALPDVDAPSIMDGQREYRISVIGGDKP